MRRVPTRLLTALLVLAPLAAGEAGQRGVAEREGIALLRGLRDPEAPGPAESGAALAELGPGVIELLLGVLEERSVPEGASGGEPQLLSRPQREAALVALERLGHDAVLPVLDARLVVTGDDDGLSARRRQAAVGILGAVAKSRELPRLFELALDPSTGDHDTALDEELVDAVRRVAVREPRAHAVLTDLVRELEPAAAEAAVLGVGATGDARGLEVLAELPLAGERLRILVASQVPLLGPSLEPSWNRELAASLADDLDSGSRNLVTSALIALGELEDFDAVPRMIDALGDGDPGVRAAAARGLGRLVHRAASPSPGAWRHWYRVEEAWLEREAPALFSASRGTDEAAAVAALEELGRHRLERHRLALEVGLALQHPSETVRLTACRALTGLGSRWGASDLRMALTDPSPAVAAAAAEALRAVTGEARGDTPQDWEGLELPDPTTY
jgi:HEAT repeat protein